MQNELQHLEILCQAFYGEDVTQREQAHSVLMPMVNSVNTIPQWQSILANSNNLQALLFATTCLSNLFTVHSADISETQKTESRVFLMNYLYQRGPELLQEAPKILPHFIRLLCRIINSTWLDDTANHTIVDQVGVFLKASTSHWVIGLKLLSSLTQEMLPSMSSKLLKQRKTTLHFKDNALPHVFTIAIKTLEEYKNGVFQIQNLNEENQILKEILQLVQSCLSYDFMAASPDETSDEQAIVMVPYTWTTLKSEEVPKMFFEIYEKCTNFTNRHDCAKLCLSILILVASLRRTFFRQGADRLKHVHVFIEQTNKIIRSNLGLENEDLFHLFARLLARISSYNQLSELTSSPHFNDWTECIFHLTIKTLEDWENHPNSTNYWLTFWNKIINPIHITNDDSPSSMFQYINQITITFIETRLKVAESYVKYLDDDMYEDPLSNDVLRTEQLTAIADLSSSIFKEISVKILELFEQIQNRLQTNMCSEVEFKEKAAWLVYITGAIFCGSFSHIFDSKFDKTSQEITDSLIGQLSYKVFRLIENTNKLEDCHEKLELSYLYFLDQFRRIFLDTHARNVTEVKPSTALLESLEVSNEESVLSMIMNKVCINLQNGEKNENILKKTVELFSQFSSSINVIHLSSKSPFFVVFAQFLLTNSTTNFIINNYTHPSFTFRNLPKLEKYRTRFMYSLCKIIFLEIKSENSKFDVFLDQISQIFEQIFQITKFGQNLQQIRTTQCKQFITGIARDLRGICEACDKNENYMLLFNWLMKKQRSLGDSRIRVFGWAMEVWWDDCDVSIPILKFISEFVKNKSNRITFEQTSNGVVLFREVSNIHVTYGTRLLKMEHAHNEYRSKYKTMATSLNIFCNLYSGKYIPFDLFEVYADNTLNNSLNMCIHMCLSIPPQDLHSYIKTLSPYYSFLSLVAQSFMKPIILEVPCTSLSHLLNMVEEGLSCFENQILVNCFGFIKHFVSYLHQIKDLSDEEAHAITNFLNTQSNSLIRILQVILQTIVSSVRPNLWMISGGLLGLILLFEDEFVKIKNSLINQQTNQTKKEKVEMCFSSLLNGIKKDFSDENKALFTKNLHAFSQDIRTLYQ